MKGDTLLIIVLIVIIILLFLFYHRQSGQSYDGLKTPLWTREKFDFNQGQTITLSFTYDYNNLPYSPDEIRFYVGLWNCGGIACPVPKGFPPTPEADGSVSLLGNDAQYIAYQNNGITTYQITMYPPDGSGLWQPGSYTSYIIAMLNGNHNVQSDPSSPAAININPPGSTPPTPTITIPSEEEYIPNNESRSVNISWTVDPRDVSSYPGFYTFSIKRSDNSITSVPMTMIEHIPSNVLSYTFTDMYPGQFSVTLTSVSQDGNYISDSIPVNFYIKLPTPGNVNVTGTS